MWNNKTEQNTLDSLLKAINSGFGVETDVRDYDGKLVISHDLPDKKSPLFEYFIAKVKEQSSLSNSVLAINIKSDGLANSLLELSKKYDFNSNLFYFDMSTPMLNYFTKVFPSNSLCTRISDIEPHPLLYERCDWIWVDSFSDKRISTPKLRSLLSDNKKLVIVSPELHGKKHIDYWYELKKLKSKNIYLCTDFPIEARAYFNGNVGEK